MHGQRMSLAALFRTISPSDLERDTLMCSRHFGVRGRDHSGGDQSWTGSPGWAVDG